jgi:2'-5' RNA ligase
MPNELALRLVATPTLQIAGIGLGNVDLLGKGHRETVDYLRSVPHRRVLAATGQAMKDGSFPIANVADLRRAIQAYGRAKNKPKAKRWIMRRARELKRPDLLPEAWGARTSNSTKVITADMAGVIAGEGDQLQEPTPQHDGVMVAIYPTPEVAQALVGHEPDDEPVDQLHVTLAYLGTVDEFDQDQLSRAEAVLSSLPTRTRTMEAQVQGVGTFIADDDANPQWYAVDCVGLAELRTDVVLALEAVGVEPRVDHDFTPHMTIRYGEPPLASEIPPGGDAKWPVGSISFVIGGGRTDITLTTPPANPVTEPGADNTEASVTLPTPTTEPLCEFVAAPGPCSLDRSAKHNWVEDVGGLPNYVCQVARAVARGGRSLDSAIPIAIGTLRNWAEGKGNVSAAVRARAASAIAEWEAKRAKAKAMPNKGSAVDGVELSVEDTTEIELFTSTLNPELSVLDLEEGFAMTAPTVPVHKAAPPAPGAPGKGGGDGNAAPDDIQVGDTVTNGEITGKVTDIGDENGVPFITVDAGDAGEVQLWPQGKPDGTPADDVKKVDAAGGGGGGAPKAGKPFAATPEVITAAGWAEDFEYYWDRKKDRTYRVIGDVVQSFIGTDGDNGEWGSDTRAAMEVRKLPGVIEDTTLHALVAAAVAEAPGADAVAPEAGRQFRIPVVIPEGVWSGDRRRFSKGSLEAKEPPMPLLWQKETDEGHKRSVTVGKITSVDQLQGGGLGNAMGVFDTHPDAVEAARQVREKFLTGVSGDVDQFDHELSQDESGRESLEINHARLVAATLVAKPAFQEASIEMVAEDGEEPVIIASAGPLFPPKAWFENPNLDGPTMLSVDDNGRVFGHIAEWNTPHTANPRLRPPRNRSGYRYFNRKPVRTQEGEDVRVGQLTLVGGHADITLDPDRASSHYDDTRSAVADVHCGEDEFGIWVAGAMRSDVTPEQVRAFRASEPSGDWREREGQLELLAVCQVNSAGFPVQPRALVASSGEVVALVAAGMIGHEIPTVEQRLEELSTLVGELVAERDARRRAEMSARITAALQA